MQRGILHRVEYFWFVLLRVSKPALSEAEGCPLWVDGFSEGMLRHEADFLTNR
jgi:hypothetical protein